MFNVLNFVGGVCQQCVREVFVTLVRVLIKEKVYGEELTHLQL